jgi:hypothetical protein
MWHTGLKGLTLPAASQAPSLPAGADDFARLQILGFFLYWRCVCHEVKTAPSALSNAKHCDSPQVLTTSRRC